MDGAVSTPWGETHTYYADGAFEFTRSEEAVGWVAQTCDRGSHVEDRLLYVDITQSWAHNGRIGTWRGTSPAEREFNIPPCEPRATRLAVRFKKGPRMHAATNSLAMTAHD
eukprot:4600165-Pleurochrysis_carterae.AAC.1